MSSRPLPTVAIVGQTNVGKSSLFNRIVGEQRAIVAREAGTTRDNVIEKVTYKLTDNHEGAFWLVDTAGLKMAEDEFEASIQDQITEAAEAADVILVVVDATQYVSDQDRIVAKKALKSKKPVILITNKVDLKGNLPPEEFLRLGIKTIIRSSAEHGQGTQQILEAITAEIPARHDTPADNTLRIALIGRPNVGKSNLFNRLAGKQQALVANIAGTTRDVNKVRVRYEKRDVELLDTAGIRRNGRIEQGPEKFSVLRSLQAIEQADVCLLLMDAGEPHTALDQKLAGIISEAGKGLVIVVSKWDAYEKDAFSRDQLAARISQSFDFVPWAPLIFTSAVTGQNVTKLFELASQIDFRRRQQFQTSKLNRLLAQCIAKHPPAGLRNRHPKLRYLVQSDTQPPWFILFGSDLRYLHWSYKRYLERALRETCDFVGTSIKISYRDEKVMKKNRELGIDHKTKERT
ncbi:ribosome biogenesis GTPase Der [Candidatus Saccharibacteria bacterium]|nr:ribosome biogenesis GTPase Der [Candidatus Saccharibacteria bacterium]